MSPTTAAAAIAATSRQPCRTCQDRQWSTNASDGLPEPCPSCKPYGARIPATSVHPPGAHVVHAYLGRTGTVLRGWRQTQGATRPGRYAYLDVQYDDGLLATAWEYDLALVKGAAA